MSIGYQEITKKLESISRQDIIAHSAINKDDFLTEFIQKFNPNGVIEIGTYNGISTVVLASVAKHVYTFDIAYRDADFVLNLFGLRHKVSIYVASQRQIDYEFHCLENVWAGYWKSWLNFNFALIDGEHSEKAIRHDFGLVKFCKRVLFHDANYEPIHKFIIDEVGAKIVDDKGIWGYWEETK